MAETLRRRRTLSAAAVKTHQWKGRTDIRDDVSAPRLECFSPAGEESILARQGREPPDTDGLSIERCAEAITRLCRISYA
jgi:hypothetical protein